MQRNSQESVRALVDRLIGESLPGLRGVDAWRAVLDAHATLMRRLDTDLRERIVLPLSDFDVLAQLGNACGELRMSELAARVYMSRSGMTRRIAALIDQGLVGRCTAQDDGRGVVVALTDAGVSRLAEAIPVHLRCVSKLFVEQLDDHELEVLERALAKVARAAGPTSERGATNVVMNDDLHRFEMTVDGQIAFLRYRRERDRIILVHTEVPKRLEGHGLGTVLALAALDYARANDLTVVPRCPFVKDFLERHPEKAAGLKIALDERKR